MNSLCFSHFLKKYIKNICVIKKIIVTLHSQNREYVLAISQKRPWACIADAQQCANNGGIAQMARALAWHARGRGFDSHCLHSEERQTMMAG